MANYIDIRLRIVKSYNTSISQNQHTIDRGACRYADNLFIYGNDSPILAILCRYSVTNIFAITKVNWFKIHNGDAWK